MKFLCLICAEKTMEQMPEADAEQHFQDYTEFTEAIRRSGHYVGCNRLLPPAAATTVRVRRRQDLHHRRALRGDQGAARRLLRHRSQDLNEAILVASRIPGAWFGCVEVRPIAEDAQTLRALGLVAA